MNYAVIFSEYEPTVYLRMIEWLMNSELDRIRNEGSSVWDIIKNIIGGTEENHKLSYLNPGLPEYAFRFQKLHWLVTSTSMVMSRSFFPHNNLIIHYINQNTKFVFRNLRGVIDMFLYDFSWPSDLTTNIALRKN